MTRDRMAPIAQPNRSLFSIFHPSQARHNRYGRAPIVNTVVLVHATAALLM
jgi:hypothetical protein